MLEQQGIRRMLHPCRVGFFYPTQPSTHSPTGGYLYIAPCWRRCITARHRPEWRQAW
jgi:hypothetical protein